MQAFLRLQATAPTAWSHQYSRLAFGWWLVAYVTGALLVMASRSA